MRGRGLADSGRDNHHHPAYNRMGSHPGRLDQFNILGVQPMKNNNVFKQDKIELAVWFILIIALAVAGMIYGG